MLVVKMKVQSTIQSSNHSIIDLILTWIQVVSATFNISPKNT